MEGQVIRLRLKKRGTRHHGINGTDLGTTPQIRRNITTYSAKVEAEKRPSEWAMPHVQFWGDWKPVYETVSGKAKLINAFEQIANYIEQAATDGILFYREPFHHVLRRYNKEADENVNTAMDKGSFERWNDE